RDALEHLDEGAQAVAVRGDEHVPAADELGDDPVLPVGLHALERDLQRLGARQRARGNVAVARVVTRMARVVRLERRWRDVVAAPPDLDLLRAVARRGLGLVEAPERPV